MDRARARGLLSAEHLTVYGTLVEAWASHKSFKPKTAPPPPDVVEEAFREGTVPLVFQREATSFFQWLGGLFK